MLAVAMSENPTYRVTGEDWDSPAPERLVVPPRVPPATTPPAPQTIAAPRLASPAAAGSAAAAPGASLASGWATATPVGTPAGAAPVVDRPAFPSGVSRRLGRLPPPIGPALERVPPRMLFGGGGLAVAAVVIVIFASARPNGVAAIATTAPTEIAPVATVSCETPTAPLPLPDLVVRSIHGEEHHLTGFAAPDAELDLDGPWPAVLGPSEASVELGSTLGDLVGYQVRFVDRTGPRTLVKLMTDGVLLRELERDPRLARYDTLILDEAHERNLNLDFLLGICRRLVARRPELKVLITSATIETRRFAEYFEGAPVVEIEGRSYPVEVRYRPIDPEDESPSPLASAVATAAGELALKQRHDRPARAEHVSEAHGEEARAFAVAGGEIERLAVVLGEPLGRAHEA